MAYLLFIEVFGIFMPLLFHSIYGVLISGEAKMNAIAYGYARNWFYVFQRVTGVYLFFFLLFHILNFRFGLIPEFVGRLPVCGVLHELDEGALIKILTEPKNALVKQYQKKFDFDNVKLKFTEDALKSVAKQAVERKVGARGLMMILEELLLDAMYTLPSQKRVKEFVITSEMVERRRAIPGEGLTGIDGAAA